MTAKGSVVLSPQPSPGPKLRFRQLVEVTRLCALRLTVTKSTPILTGELTVKLVIVQNIQRPDGVPRRYSLSPVLATLVHLASFDRLFNSVVTQIGVFPLSYHWTEGAIIKPTPRIAFGVGRPFQLSIP